MRRRVIAGGLAVAAVVGVGYTTYAANADAASYRTAAAVVGDVEQTLEVTGSVEPAGRADLAFATSGTVDAIRVEAGDTVRAGAVLGSVDDTGLRATLQRARATLATARAQLESDEDAQVASVTTTTTTTTTTTPTTSTTPVAKPTTTPDPAVDQLAALQKAVTDAQSTVSASLTAAQDALAAQQAACAEDPAAQACADALVVVQGAQEQVSTDQDALQAALDDLAEALGEALANQQETPQETQPEQPQAQQPQVQQQTTTQSAQPSGSVSVSAATLAKDQAAIDAARADVITAEQAVRTATVTAPFAGKVVAVDAAEGDSVSSGTAVFTLVAPGTTTVQVEATTAQVQQLAVGQDAVATPIGSGSELAGTVTQISTIPDDAGTYPVTITLARKHLDIATGLTAAVSVVVGAAEDVVTVPASAVTDGSVQVVGEDGTASRTPVTTGVVGAMTVEIAEGLEEGAEVVLADLDRALPTTDESSQGGFPTTGGFGGAPTFARMGGG